MAYQIDEKCVKCSVCAGACPVDAIFFDESIKRFQIHHDICTECGTCIDVCAVNAVMAIVDENEDRDDDILFPL